MAAQGYEFYLRALKVSLTNERSERMRDTSAREDKIRIPGQPCNILYIHWITQLISLTFEKPGPEGLKAGWQDTVMRKQLVLL